MHFDAAAEAFPWFLAVSVTEKPAPTVALAGGLLTVLSIKSGFVGVLVAVAVRVGVVGVCVAQVQQPAIPLKLLGTHASLAAQWGF